MNRVIEETNELSDTRYFSYDAVGNFIEKIDRNDRYTEYEYDNVFRLIEERWLDPTDDTTVIQTINWEYDIASQLTEAADSFAEYDFTYDNLGRTTSIVADIAGLTPLVTLAHSFDANSRRTQLSATIGTTADFKNDYTFDNLNRMTRVTQQDVMGGNTVADKRVDLAHNAAGQFDEILRYADLAGTDLVVTSTYGYDLAGRLTSLAYTKGMTTFAGYSWAYDAANRMTSFANSQHASEDATYNYDDIGQLTGADRTGTTNDEDFEYDANGNRIEANGDTYATGDANRMESDGTFNYTYDAEGNTLTKARISNDPAEDKTVEYTWDHRNRLTKVTFKDNSDDVTKVVEQAYDAFNRWVSKTVDPDGDLGSSPVEETFFIYDGNQVALQFDGDDAADLSHRYVWGPAVDQILADEEVNGDVRWAFTDHQGTVRDVAEYDAGMDSTTVVNHNTYDSFGTKTNQSSAAHDMLFGYTGRAFDEDTGLQNNHHRWLSNGRWLSEDWIMDDTQNSYRYARNTPLNAADPSGLAIAVNGPMSLNYFDPAMARRYPYPLGRRESVINVEGDRKVVYETVGRQVGFVSNTRVAFTKEVSRTFLFSRDTPPQPNGQPGDKLLFFSVTYDVHRVTDFFMKWNVTTTRTVYNRVWTRCSLDSSRWTETWHVLEGPESYENEVLQYVGSSDVVVRTFARTEAEVLPVIGPVGDPGPRGGGTY